MRWKVKPGYRYTRKHTWASREGTLITAGMTDYAQDMMKDIVYVELPEAGRLLKTGEVFAVAESIKAVFECFSPADGAVVAVNNLLSDQPELINHDPYGSGWMVKLEVEEGYQSSDQLTDEEYSALLLGKGP